MLFSVFSALVLASFAGARSVGTPRIRDTVNSHPPLSQSSVVKRDVLSSNWAGPVKAGSGISVVEATWTVPNVSIPVGRSKTDQYWFYQWVGIDGVGNCTVLLQGGTGHTITNGVVDVYTWYEFYPANWIRGAVKVSIGDEVYTKVTATSNTTGTIHFWNKSTGFAATHRVKSVHGPLCQKSADWIAEDPGDLVPFPDFTTYDFHKCKATTSSGETLNLGGSEKWYMKQRGRVLASSEITSDTDVTFKNG
ncbi:hypothetical protein RJ55_07042 [Drechmeria coniospora]|nr:hypothetical protein RJ55_07042 [Drechmeria coniospora]